MFKYLEDIGQVNILLNKYAPYSYLDIVISSPFLKFKFSNSSKFWAW